MIKNINLMCSARSGTIKPFQFPLKTGEKVRHGMNESISDGIFDSNEESILRAYAGLTITNGGVNLNRSELPQSVTVDEALSNDVSTNDLIGTRKALPTGDVMDDEEKAFLNKILESAKTPVAQTDNNISIGEEIASVPSESANDPIGTRKALPTGDVIDDEEKAFLNKILKKNKESITNKREAGIATDSNRVSSDILFVADFDNLSLEHFILDNDYNAKIIDSSFRPFVIDAEKYSHGARPKDDNMCWAAADANMLFRTG